MEKQERFTTNSSAGGKEDSRGQKPKKKKYLTAYNIFFKEERANVLMAGKPVFQLFDSEVAPFVRAGFRPKSEFQALVQVIAKRWKVRS